MTMLILLVFIATVLAAAGRAFVAFLADDGYGHNTPPRHVRG